MYQPRPGMKLEQGQMLETPVVFSKSFGFIKWLVNNNNKIKMELLKYKYMDLRELVREDDIVVMLLSISDTPIEDLILYLK